MVKEYSTILQNVSISYDTKSKALPMPDIFIIRDLTCEFEILIRFHKILYNLNEDNGEKILV